MFVSIVGVGEHSGKKSYTNGNLYFGLNQVFETDEE